MFDALFAETESADACPRFLLVLLLPFIGAITMKKCFSRCNLVGDEMNLPEGEMARQVQLKYKCYAVGLGSASDQRHSNS